MRSTCYFIFMQIILGLIVADLFTSTMHWFEDTYLVYCTKLPLMSIIAKGNELHHYYPRGVLLKPYGNLEVGSSSLIFILLLATLFMRRKPQWLVNNAVFLATFYVMSVFANAAFHKWQHMRECERPTLITILYKLNILQSDKRHRQHHLKASTNYGVLFPISNIILDNLQVWRALEMGIQILTGVAPNHKQGYNDYQAIHTPIHAEAIEDCPRQISAQEYAWFMDILDKTNHC